MVEDCLVLGRLVIGVLFGRAGRFHLELIDGLYTAAEERGWGSISTATS
jgi:hypothetical protein